ncbi:signal peptidase I [Candidatus Uhrbacteria bacterium]|nr:signal peptidase I [Candidatus Uhrbacteria bacterium]
MEDMPSVPERAHWSERFGVFGSVIVFIVELVQILAISAAIIIPIRAFLIQPFIVRGASMEPNFYDNEYLVIDEISYRFREPERGEIIVFQYPRDPSQYFIKRVIGLPGETVEVDEGRVKIYNDAYPEGLPLKEPYLDGAETVGKKRVELGAQEYYLLGDNRDYSLDSRSFGPVGRDLMVGRVWFRGFPFSRLGGFQTPVYDTL